MIYANKSINYLTKGFPFTSCNTYNLSVTANNFVRTFIRRNKTLNLKFTIKFISIHFEALKSCFIFFLLLLLFFFRCFTSVYEISLFLTAFATKSAASILIIRKFNFPLLYYEFLIIFKSNFRYSSKGSFKLDFHHKIELEKILMHFSNLSRRTILEQKIRIKIYKRKTISIPQIRLSANFLFLFAIYICTFECYVMNKLYTSLNSADKTVFL